jgi:hypothetical protein
MNHEPSTNTILSQTRQTSTTTPDTYKYNTLPETD